jgi:hypothetical protein
MLASAARTPGGVSTASSLRLRFSVASAARTFRACASATLADLTAAPKVGLTSGCSLSTTGLPACPVSLHATARRSKRPSRSQNSAAPAPRLEGVGRLRTNSLQLRCSFLRVWASTNYPQTAAAGRQTGRCLTPSVSSRCTPLRRATRARPHRNAVRKDSPGRWLLCCVPFHVLKPSETGPSDPATSPCASTFVRAWHEGTAPRYASRSDRQCGSHFVARLGAWPCGGRHCSHNGCYRTRRPGTGTRWRRTPGVGSPPSPWNPTARFAK